MHTLMYCNLFSCDIRHVLQIYILYFHVLQLHVRHLQSTRLDLIGSVQFGD